MSDPKPRNNRKFTTLEELQATIKRACDALPDERIIDRIGLIIGHLPYREAMEVCDFVDSVEEAKKILDCEDSEL